MSEVRRLVYQVYYDDGGVLTPVTDVDGLPVEITNETLSAQINSEYLFSDYQAALADAGTITTGWIDTEQLSKYTIEVNAPTAIPLTVETATGAGGTGSTSSATVTPPLASYSTTVPPRNRYVKITITNDTGGDIEAALAIKALYGATEGSSTFPALFEPLDVSQAQLVVSIAKGQQPDGDYVNTPADGNVFTHGTPLSASGSFTTDAFDTAGGWKAIELYIATDQVSLGEGIVIEYTDDAQAVSPTWYPGPVFTFGADAVDAGFLIKRFAPALHGFRLTYTNGGFAQGSFYLSLELKNGVTEPTSVSIENDIDPATSAQLVRGVDLAINDLGVYGNIERGPLGGKRVSIYEHESETPIKPLNVWSGNATSVGSGSATQIATSTPAGTKSVTIQADPDNTKVVYIGPNNSVTSGNAPYALAAGDSITFELDNTPTFYGRSGSGSQTVRWIFIGET